MSLYFKTNNYIPFKIHWNNLKIDEIVIIRDSLDSKKINIYSSYEDNVVDDDEFLSSYLQLLNYKALLFDLFS